MKEVRKLRKLRKKFNFNFVIAGLGLVAYILGIAQDEIRAREEEKYIDERVRREVDSRLKQKENEEES